MDTSSDLSMSYGTTICSSDWQAPAVLLRNTNQMLLGFATHAHLDLSGRVLQEGLHPSGQGAYCDVFKGLSLAHGKYVAIKRFREYVFGGLSEKFTKGLARELEIWAKLRHPNVLPLLGFIMDDVNSKYPSLVSEWMPNGTVLQYCMAYPTACILNLTKGVAAGLFYLHSKGVVHSDMKSDNVLVTATGVPQLADFGVSRLFVETGTVDSTSHLKGSVRWISVELLRGEANAQGSSSDCRDTKRLVSLQADVWAFGMTIYELLTRNRPYHHLPSDFQVFFAIISGKLPTNPSRIEEGIAETDEKTLWTLCKRCWSTKPEDRPTMMDVTFDLNCGFRMVDRSRAGSKSRQESAQGNQSNSDSRSVQHGGVGGEQVIFPRTSKKARALISDAEVDPHRESQSNLFIKQPVQNYRQKVVNGGSKPSLLSQRLREEALRASGQARELTPQQRICIEDVFQPTAADWSWRRRTKKSKAAEPVATILSINCDVDRSAESPGSDDPESEYVQAAGPQRSSQTDSSLAGCPRNSLRSSQDTAAVLSPKEEGGVFSSQGLALKILAALHIWAKSRPRGFVADVKDIKRQKQSRLQPICDDHEAGRSHDSVVFTQRLQLPPAIAPIAIQRVTGFIADNLAEGKIRTKNRHRR